MIGHILDNRYKILEKVGTGGMASVYKAQDILLDRIVAVKILHSKYGNDHDFVVRFRQEAQAAAKLSHPNIVNTTSATMKMSITSSWNSCAAKR